ncbi:MAG: nitroreductase family protein [Nanoarchaeota archaeon]|nr:nitroreductase family protein [Nanoarchaeota archaeon]
MDTLECIRTRRSIRKFLTKPIEYDKVLQIVEAGSLAPSSGNLQNWRFVVLTERDLIKSLPGHCLNQEYVDAPVVIVVCASDEQVEQHYGIRGTRLYSVQNCAAAIENMLLAAHALGLGACWIGAFDEEKIMELLNVSKHARPQAIIAMGYPDDVPSTKRLRGLVNVTYFNQYGLKVRSIADELRDYSDLLAKKAEDVKEVVDSGKKKIHAHFKRFKKPRVPKF